MTKKELDELQAEEIIKQAEIDRVANCEAEIAAILDKYNCLLIPEIVIIGDKISASTKLYAKRLQQ
jgi:hypothetical protein